MAKAAFPIPFLHYLHVIKATQNIPKMVAFSLKDKHVTALFKAKNREIVASTSFDGTMQNHCH